MNIEILCYKLFYLSIQMISSFQFNVTGLVFYLIRHSYCASYMAVLMFDFFLNERQRLRERECRRKISPLLAYSLDAKNGPDLETCNTIPHSSMEQQRLLYLSCVLRPLQRCISKNLYSVGKLDLGTDSLIQSADGPRDIPSLRFLSLLGFIKATSTQIHL